MEYARKMRAHSYDINELMSLQDQYGRKTVKLEYDQFFSSPWAANFDIEQEHRRNFMVKLLLLSSIINVILLSSFKSVIKYIL